MTPSVRGAGLGFRRELLPQLRQNDISKIDFFELAPENWLGLGGKFAKQLREFTERFPFSSHGLSLSLGGTDPLDLDLLRSIKIFLDEHHIDLYTEHLSWCAFEGHLYDLLPIPFSEDSVQWMAARIRTAQDILERRIGVENSSYYFVPPGSHMDEAEFINALIEESGCFLHLDVNNLYVNSNNLGYDPLVFLSHLSPSKVGYMHIAGHFVEQDGWIIDTHGTQVIDPVWELFSHTCDWLEPNQTNIGVCLERDFNFPPLNDLLSEVEHIKHIQRRSTLAKDAERKQQHG